jgi:hypothetical protein
MHFAYPPYQEGIMIEVESIDDRTFKVTVQQETTTTHTVTVEPVYCQKISKGKASPERLVEKSFEFLLKREPNTSILGTFDLPVISRYFPEYEKEIAKEL